MAPKRRAVAPNWSLCGRTACFLLLVVLCLGWTLWLVALTLMPNRTINRVMRTDHLDQGTFWHFADAPAAVGGVGVAGLALAALGYVYALWVVVRSVVCGRQHRLRRRSSSTAKVMGMVVPPSTTVGVAGPTFPADSRTTSVLAMLTRSTNRVATELLVPAQANAKRERVNALMKAGDVVLHVVFLVQLLEDGLPTPLVVVFAVIVTLHALSFAVVFSLSNEHLGRTHVLLDALFDFLVAVAFPMLTLFYSFSLFTFDTPLMEINLRVFPPGLFERYAAMVADPRHVVAVRHSLESLQVNSVLKIFTRVGTMLALVRRSAQLAWMLAEECSGGGCYVGVYGKRQRRLSLGLVVVAIAIVVFTVESVRTSQRACEPHVECVQHAHRWLVGVRDDDRSRCPCLAIVDRDIVVATHEEWTHPPNRTAKIAQLAAAGTLKTLQLVNRGLTVFPTELRRCHRLRHVSLFYTNTERLPDWFGEFQAMEYLHIEGKYPRSSLQHLPETVFDHMPKLTFLHLGMHGLARLPSLKGLTGLRSLTFAGLPNVETLPTVSFSLNLQQLSVIGLPRAETFPALAGLDQLTVFTVADRGAFCCNGFLGDGTCNLTHSMCGYHPLWDAPPVSQCVGANQTASMATRATFNRFNTSACFGDIPPPGLIKLDSSIDDVTQCDGVLYRECRVAGFDNVPAMCYNTRWMVIACNTYPFAIEMRRQQIQLGRGLPCNPEHEAWLGCGS